MGNFYKDITSSKVMKNNNNNSNSNHNNSGKDQGGFGFMNWFGKKNTENSLPAPQPRGNNRRKPESANKPLDMDMDMGAGLFWGGLLLLLAIILYFSKSIYDYFAKKVSTYLPVGGDVKKCVTGCQKGTCDPEKGECKTDAECNMCQDEDGTVYGSVEVDSRPADEKLAEDEIAADRRLRSLEATIEERNREIQKLNRYIESVNHDRLQAELLLKKALEANKPATKTS